MLTEQILIISLFIPVAILLIYFTISNLTKKNLSEKREDKVPKKKNSQKNNLRNKSTEALRIVNHWENSKVLALFYVIASMIINRLFEDEGIEAILMILSVIILTLLHPFVMHTYFKLFETYTEDRESENQVSIKNNDD